MLDGSSGSRDAEPGPERPSTTAYTAGSTVSVATVATRSPPMTARPRGAAWARSPVASANGIMPAIIAVAVIRIARRRPRAPSITASCTESPSRRAASAKLTRSMAFATEMPTAMMAPMNDCTFSVVRVSKRISSTPQITAGTAETTAIESRKD